MTLRIAGLQLGFALSATASASAQTCNLTWQLIGPLSHFSESGTVLIEHDIDGGGPIGPVLVSAGYESNVPMWLDGGTWQELRGTDPGSRILDCLATDAIEFDFDGPGEELPSLVISGRFRLASGNYHSVIRWAGNEWSPLLASSVVVSVTAFDPDQDGPEPERLFALGSQFDVPSGTQHGVVMWNGVEWVGTGFPTSWAIPSIWGGQFGRFDFDGPGPLPVELVISGGFRAFFPATGGVARWQQGAWTFAGVAIPQFQFSFDFIETLTEFDFDADGPLPPRLVAAGSRSLNSDFEAWIAYLDGTAWVPLATPAGAGAILDLERFDPDGDGPQPTRLCAVGINAMHRFVGQGWQQLANPRTLLTGYKMLPTNWNGRPSLVIGGEAWLPGGGYTVAVLRGCGPDCIGDFDGDRNVNLTDLAMLLSNFGSNESSTDLDGDNATSLTDLALFLIEFGTNCPAP